MKPGTIYNTAPDKITIISSCCIEDHSTIIVFNKTEDDHIQYGSIRVTKTSLILPENLGEEVKGDLLQETRQYVLEKLKAYNFDTNLFLNLWEQIDRHYKYQVGKVYKRLDSFHLLIKFDKDGSPLFYNRFYKDSTKVLCESHLNELEEASESESIKMLLTIKEGLQDIIYKGQLASEYLEVVKGSLNNYTSSNKN